MGFFDKIKKIGIFNGFSELTEDFYEELEESLVMADLGAETTMEAVDELRERCKARGIKDTEGARQCMREILAEYLDLGGAYVDMSGKPAVILFIGVNGVGKTTSIGKLAAHWKGVGRRVVLCAGDTFRAAAAEQLYTALDNNSALDAARDTDALTAAIYIRSGVKEAGVTGKNLWNFFDVDKARVAAITSLI